jgi:hypothetical protein
MKRTARKLLALAVLCLPAAARAGYIDDLLRQVEELGRSSAITAEEKKALEEGIKSWSDARRSCFEDLGRMVSDDNAGNKQKEPWENRVKTAREALGRSIGEALRNVKDPTDAAKNFRATVQQEEDKVLAALGESKVGEMRDLIVQNRHKVKEMSTLLDTKWEGLLNLDGSYDEMEKAAVNEMQQMVRELTHEISREETSWLTQLVIAKNEGKGKVVMTPMQAIRASIKGSLEYLAKTTGRYKETKQRLKDGIRSESGGIFFLFKDVRRDTDLFLRENQFQRAKGAYDDARQGLDKAVSACTTSGQKDDVGRLAKDVLDALSKHLSATESVQNEFIKRHEKKFFGPVGPDIKKALNETELWRDWERSLDGQDLDSLARKWREDANRLYELDSSDLTEENRNLFRGMVKDDLERFIKMSEEMAREYDESIAVLKAKAEAERELE